MIFIRRIFSPLILTLLLPAIAQAQTPEQMDAARLFFTVYDLDSDTQLSEAEFIDGFITQSRMERPSQTRLAMLLYGKNRISSCLSLGFERADQDADGLLALDELGQAYAEDAFSDLREMC